MSAAVGSLVSVDGRLALVVGRSIIRDEVEVVVNLDSSVEPWTLRSEAVAEAPAFAPSAETYASRILAMDPAAMSGSARSDLIIAQRKVRAAF